MQLQAPTYAQDLGAGGGADGWWCQLPHATELPTGFAAEQRNVSPLDNGTYALYSTQYGTHRSASNIQLADDVEAVQFPGHLDYGPPLSGKKVRLAKGVTGSVTKGEGWVEVTWRFPTHGVPKYLKAVATVSVTGNGVPESVVLAVARHVEPN